MSHVPYKNTYVLINLIGGLENILFQLSTAYAYAKNTNRKLYIKNSSNIVHSTCTYSFLSKFDKFENGIENGNKIIFTKMVYYFHNTLTLNHMMNTMLN